MTAPGRTPYDFMVSASATWIANSVGWTRSMPVTVTGPALRGRFRAVFGRPI